MLTKHKTTISKCEKARKTIKPKVGDLVSVCYDGKWGRVSIGKVLKTRGFAVQVEFPQYAAIRKTLTSWFIRTSDQSFATYAKDIDCSIHRDLLGLSGEYYILLHIDVYKFMNPDKTVQYKKA